MGERYIPPEALGISPPEKKKTPERVKSPLRRRAEKVFQALALVAVSLGAEGAVHAKEAPPEKGKDETAEKFKLKDRIEKDTPVGHVRYVQAEGTINDAGLKGRETVTRVNVVDEGDPAVEGDELGIGRSWYRVDTDDGKTLWDMRHEVSGELAGRENPFGQISGFPRSIREGKMDESMARTEANLDLQGFAFELQIVRALRAVGKGDTPESQRTLGALQEQVRKFQKRHPDVPIDQKVLGEVFGSQGR